MFSCLSIILSASFVAYICVSAAVVNITVDDQGFDNRTGSLIVYSPTESWETFSGIYLPMSGAWNHTLHEMNFPGSSSQTGRSAGLTPGNLTFTFNGQWT